MQKKIVARVSVSKTKFFFIYNIINNDKYYLITEKNRESTEYF